MTAIVEVVQRRHEILEALEHGPKGKPELTDSTSHARSTIDRGIRDLEAADLVRSDGSDYRLSAAGRRILDAFQTFRDTANVYERYAEAIEGVADDDELPPVVLDGAEVDAARSTMPTRPVKKGHEGLAEADEIYSTCPVLLAYHSEYWNAALPETDVDITVIYTTDVVETMNAEYPNWRADVVETGLVTPYCNDDIPGYALTIVDGLHGDPDDSVVRIMIYDDHRVETLLSNRSEAAIDWARERFEQWRTDAELVATVD